MNKDQVTGTLEQVAGKVKQGVGEAVGNEKLANEGIADQVKGAAQESWGNLKDGVKEIQDFRKEAASHERDEKRQRVSEAVRDAKEKVQERVQEKVDEFKQRHTA